jgi:hypothetical protein
MLIMAIPAQRPIIPMAFIIIILTIPILILTAADFMARQAQLRNSICGFALLVLMGPGCKQTPQPVGPPGMVVNGAGIQLQWVNGLAQLNHQPFNGTLFTLHPGTADTAAISTYSNGRENGVWKQFYEKGRLKESRTFINGKKTGVYTAWWQNGRKQLEYLFADDEYEGPCREWNADGLLTREMYYKKGHEEGLQRCWYDNGKVKANYSIVNGRRYGLLGTKNCVNVSDSIFNQ